MRGPLFFALLNSVHCLFRSGHLLCSSGEIVNVLNLDPLSTSRQYASSKAAEMGGRLPTAHEVREIIFSIQGPLFRDQVWIPVSGNDYIQVGVNHPLIPTTCKCEDRSNDSSLDCICKSRTGTNVVTSIQYSSCHDSKLQNLDGKIVCAKKKPVDSFECESLQKIPGLGYSYNLCQNWSEQNISIPRILYVVPRQSQIQKSIQSCTAESATAFFYYSNPCPAGFTCISSVCVNLTMATAQIVKFGLGPPNNVYFAFSLWDDECRPIALPLSTLATTLQVYQKIPGKLQSQFVRQSVKESWNGVLPHPIRSTTRIVLLCDHSGSLRHEWSTIRSSITKFVQTLLNDPFVHENNKESDTKLIGPGPTKQAPKSIFVNAMVFDGRKDLLPVSPEFDDFTEITTPGYIESLQTASISDEGYDPSTNLNGAIVEGLALLKTDKEKKGYRYLKKNGGESKRDLNQERRKRAADHDGGEIKQYYLVVFTDGTDQANRVHDVEVLAAVKEAQKFTSIYAVLLNGETSGGGSGSNLDQMRTYCPAGVYTISKLDEMKQKFAEISGLLSALINNRGVFLYCASIRSGTAEVQLRVEGSTSTETIKTYLVNTSRFNTESSVCTENEARNIRVPNPSFSLRTQDMSRGYCERKRSNSGGWWKETSQCIEENIRRIREEERKKEEEAKKMMEEKEKQKKEQEEENEQNQNLSIFLPFLLISASLVTGYFAYATISKPVKNRTGGQTVVTFSKFFEEAKQDSRTLRKTEGDQGNRSAISPHHTLSSAAKSKLKSKTAALETCKDSEQEDKNQNQPIVNQAVQITVPPMQTHNNENLKETARVGKRRGSEIQNNSNPVKESQKKKKAE